MLFNPPTPAPRAVRQSAASAAFAQVPGLDPVFSNLLAGRKKSLGTELLSLFKRMCRAAPGWLSARPSQILHPRVAGAFGTARRPKHPHTRVRPAPGWLAVADDAGFPPAAAPDGYHRPVLTAEVLAAFGPLEGRFIIDGTLGGGGHSEQLLEAGARVLGVDRDPEALAHARQRLARFGGRFRTQLGNFADLPGFPELTDGEQADGLLLDLGVSSRQLDAAERGFSFMHDGPLDMRMGPGSGISAAEWLASVDHDTLVRTLREFGEEPKARRIATAIVDHRASRPLATTGQLAALIEKTIGRHSRTHPATRTFQAIRIAVNRELESLATALDNVPTILKPGARLVIITFHSLEDRIVKRHLRDASSTWIDRPEWPQPRPNPELRYRLLTRKAVAPTAEETKHNPRARSAKLRAAELIVPQP
jgi:16S rRNA (cytosine1402-N4)-methyltransferase